jgi:hypothetical protein
MDITFKLHTILINNKKGGLDQNWEKTLQLEKENREKTHKKRHQEVQEEIREENEHLRMKFLLTEVGRNLGYLFRQFFTNYRPDRIMA